MSDNKPRAITIDPELKEKYEQLINKTVCWIIIDKDGKSKVNISELGNTILEVHNCIIVENGNKDDFYEYNKVKGYWELRNIKSIKSVITELLNRYNVWTDRVARDAFHFVCDSIKRVKWKDTFGKKQGNYFNFKNGVWNWDDFKLQEHSPKYYFTSCVDYDLVVTDKYPNSQAVINSWKNKNSWLETEKWLALSVGENMQSLMEFIGYIFYPSYEPIQLFVILLSPGGDGKTTFMNHLTTLVGNENTSFVSLIDLADKRPNNFSHSELYNKYLNEYDDISNAYIPDTTVLQKLTGGSSITAPVKNRPGITLFNYAKLLFASNDLPSFSNTTNAFLRRINVIKFFKINNFEQTIDMKKVKKERGEFVYKCMVLAKDAMKRKEIKQTESIIAQRNNWIEDNDPIKQFINEDCTLAPTEEVDENDLYGAYKVWCIKYNFKPVSKTKFKKELENKGIFRSVENKRIDGEKRKRRYFYKGISLN